MTTITYRWRCAHTVAGRVLRAAWWLRCLRGDNSEPPYRLMGPSRKRCLVCWDEHPEPPIDYDYEDERRDYGLA